ncbi:hypothetical protein LDENG_00160390, partial [Lucifuga dentata]
ARHPLAPLHSHSPKYIGEKKTVLVLTYNTLHSVLNLIVNNASLGLYLIVYFCYKEALQSNYSEPKVRHPCILV